MPEQAITLPPEWLRQIYDILMNHPEGLREIDLIDTLSERSPGTLSRADLTHPLSRFRVHFMLFHALYILRDELIDEAQAVLEITPLCIRLAPWQASDTQKVGQHDPLSHYYRNWNNLSQSDLSDVMGMLGGFWQHMAAPANIQSALEILSLGADASWLEMKRAYRKRCMTHHPDRGGNTADYQKLQTAYDVLKVRYGHGSNQ